MTSLTPADIVQAALQLPAAERLRIANEIHSSVVPPGILVEGEPGFFEELDRRAAAVRSGEMSTSSWEEVEAELTEMLERKRAERGS